MKEVILIILGAAGGFLVHSITMKVSFKQRTIDNKIKVYDALIAHWVQMRNFVYSHHGGEPNPDIPPQVMHEFDQMYGSSQTFIGEAILVCENDELTTDINELNEILYRTEWHMLSLDEANQKMEKLKIEALGVIGRMREDIKTSTRFELKDFLHILSGFSHKR